MGRAETLQSDALLIWEVASTSKCGGKFPLGTPHRGGIPETEAGLNFFSSLSKSASSQNSKFNDLQKDSKMWKSHSMIIPKYLAEDVDICRMLELLKEEEERVVRLKEELKTTMMRRRRFNSCTSWSTISWKKGA